MSIYLIGLRSKSILLFITLGRLILESQLKPYTINLYFEHFSKLLAKTSTIDKYFSSPPVTHTKSLSLEDSNIFKLSKYT